MPGLRSTGADAGEAVVGAEVIAVDEAGAEDVPSGASH